MPLYPDGEPPPRDPDYTEAEHDRAMQAQAAAPAAGWARDRDGWWHRPLRSTDRDPSPFLRARGFLLARSEPTDQDEPGPYFMRAEDALAYDKESPNG